MALSLWTTASAIARLRTECWVSAGITPKDVVYPQTHVKLVDHLWLAISNPSARLPYGSTIKDPDRHYYAGAIKDCAPELILLTLPSFLPQIFNLMILGMCLTDELLALPELPEPLACEQGIIDGLAAVL